MKNIIKWLVVAVILFLGGMCLANAQQEKRIKHNVSVSIYQDPVMAFFKDDNGNKPFTLDTRIEISLMGKDLWDLGYLHLGVTYEHAELAGGLFQRGGVQGGFTFEYMHFFHLFNYKMTPMVGFGAINRLKDVQSWISLEASINFNFPINNWMDLSVKPTMMQRGDLWAKYRDESGLYNPLKWRPNIYVGLEFKIPTSRRDGKTSGKARCDKRKRIIYQ